MMADIQQLPQEIVQAKGNRYAEFQTDYSLNDEKVLFEWACRQTYIPLANMMTAAALIGIDSCPIEGFLLEQVNRLLVEEGIIKDDEFGVSVMVSFGYRAEDIKPKTRRDFDEVIQWID